MNRQTVRQSVRDALIEVFIRKNGTYYVPVAVSNRHVHLSAEDVERLFGPGYQLTPIKELSQPEQYACKEVVTVTGSKGKIEKVRVLGPARSKTQLEITKTDSFKLGIKPVVRMSGDIEGTPGATLTAGDRTVELTEGVIVSERHLHISPDEALLFDLKDGDRVRLVKEGKRETVYGQVAVRSGEGHRLEVHIDTDEANAADIQCGELLRLEKYV